MAVTECQQKSPYRNAGAFLLADYLGELIGADFLAIGHSANTKSFSPDVHILR